MEVRYTGHTMDQMADRGITEAMVQGILDNPRWMPATTRNTRYDGIAPDGRRLCVVVAEEWQPPRVVTVFWYEEERNA